MSDDIKDTVLFRDVYFKELRSGEEVYFGLNGIGVFLVRSIQHKALVVLLAFADEVSQH